MATVSSVEFPKPALATYEDGLDRHGWGFACLLLVVATLFIRPADIFPQLHDAPVYQVLITATLFIAYRSIGAQLSTNKLAMRPVTACLLLLIGSVALSHLTNGFFWGARDSALTAIKVFALYLLIAGLVNTPQRLETFAKWLVVAIGTMSALAMADQFDIVKLSVFSPIEDSYSADGETVRKLVRIRGSGIFEDPNDLGLVVVVGIVLNLYFLLKPAQGWRRYLWLVPGIVLCTTLAQTYSRGAFLALACTAPAWLFYQYGWRVAIAGSLALVPVISFPFAGRMTEFNAVFEGTGQSRIQIWSDSLQIFRNAPFFGIGEGMLSEQSDYVGHNSFLQCFAELGFLGGTLFIAIFMTAIAGMLPNSDPVRAIDASEQRLRGALFAVVVDYAIGIQSLSRQFVAPTFLVLGIAMAAHFTGPYPLRRAWCIGNELLLRSLFASVAFLALVYIVVRLLIHTR